MKKSKFTEAQVAAALRECASGPPIRQVQRMKDLAAARPRDGYRRIHTLLRREGWKDGLERVYRFYKLDELAVRRKARKKHRAGTQVTSKALDAWGLLQGREARLHHAPVSPSNGFVESFQGRYRDECPTSRSLQIWTTRGGRSGPDEKTTTTFVRTLPLAIPPQRSTSRSGYRRLVRKANFTRSS